jgi:hypothetical protein
VSHRSLGIVLLTLVTSTPSPIAAQSAPAATAQPQDRVSPSLLEGPANTAVGRDALSSITSGFYNVALGNSALHDNTTGTQNTATGGWSLFWNSTGEYNTATGMQALFLNTVGGYNTATGSFALTTNDTGWYNTAIGHSALYGNTTGHSNTAIGDNAGALATAGSYNVYLGAAVSGVADEGNTMRLGLPYDSSAGTGQNQTFIAGIHGTPLAGPAVPVYVDVNGQLGTIVAPVQSGSVSEPVSSQAAALANRVGEEEARNRRQAAEIADLRARLALLERLVAERAAGRER